MEERCFNFYILTLQDIKCRLIYKVLKSPPISQVMCNELVAKVLKLDSKVQDLNPLANTPKSHLVSGKSLPTC